MAWFRHTAEEINQNNFEIEERLAKIVQLEAELNQNNQRIKELTSTIVRTLDSDVDSVGFAKINPILVADISSPLQDLVPAIEVIETESRHYMPDNDIFILISPEWCR